MPEIDASVSTGVVFWNDAAQMNDSVESDVVVLPSSRGQPHRKTITVGDHALVLSMKR